MLAHDRGDGAARRSPRRRLTIASLAAVAALAVAGVGTAAAEVNRGPAKPAQAPAGAEAAAGAGQAPAGDTAGEGKTAIAGAAPLCGASFHGETPGETYQQALTRVDGYYNGLESARVFYPGLPQAWPGKLNTGGRPMIVSFKVDPAEVLAGTHDARLRQWFRTAPRNQDIYWTYYHEPEDNIANGDFTAAQYRQAWQRLSGLAAEAKNPRLRATLILMGFSVNPASHRNWRDYYPGKQYVQVMGWDVYNHKKGGYTPAADMFARVIAVSRGEGLPFGIAETGSDLVAGDTGAQRAAWLRDMARHLTDNHAVFVDYFDIDLSSHNEPDYRLRDAPSQAAWREFCS